MRSVDLQLRLVLVALAALIQAAAGCGGIRIERRYEQRSYDWLMYGGAPDRTNQSHSIVSPPLKPVWEYNALGGISGTPLVKDSIVIVGTLHNELHAIRLSNGEELGTVSLESAAAGTPVWDGNYVYVPGALGMETVASFSLRDGKRQWSARYGPAESSLLLIGEFLYATTLDGVLVCLKKLDGTEFWKFEPAEKELRKPARSSPASDGEVIAFGSDDGWIFAVERLTGKLRWKYQGGASIFATPVLWEGICVVGSVNGVVYAVDTRTGELRWKYDTGSRIYAPAAASGSKALICAANGKVIALSLDSGKQIWSFSARSVVSSAPLIDGEIVYVGSLDRKLYALRLQTGEELWHYEMEGRIKVSPVIWGDFLLLTSEDKYITAFRPTHQ